MALRIDRSTWIDLPVEDVWALVADPREDPRWCRRVLSCEQVEGDGPGPGARYRAVHRPQRLRAAMELDVRVEAFEPPHRMTLVERDTDGVFHVEYTLRSEAGGTRISQHDVVELPGVPRLAHPIARFEIGRHVGEQLRALKRLLEVQA